MTKRSVALSVAAMLAAVAMQAMAAKAATMVECSAKYKAAKAAGTLDGMSWNEFRNAQCGLQATAAPATAVAQAQAPAAAPAAPAAAPTAPAAAPAPKPAAAPAPKPAAAPAAGSAVFPSAVDAKYAKDTPGRARRKTCLDQYRANKKTNANGGLKWLAHNGYWSQCNKKLKGS